MGRSMSSRVLLVVRCNYGGKRVQKFTPVGGTDLIPSPFGTNEIQALTVNAGSGNFKLTFGAEFQGAQGTGILTAGSRIVTDVNTTKGAFAVGQPISN